jgi:hypothetical protein
LHILCMGATAISKSAIKVSPQLLFLFNAIFNLFCEKNLDIFLPHVHVLR